MLRPALMRHGNTLGRATTARVITAITTAAPGIIMADLLTQITATIRAGRPQAGVTAYRRDIIRIPMGVVIRTVVTTPTRTIRQPMLIADRWLQLCSGAWASLVTTTA